MPFYPPDDPMVREADARHEAGGMFSHHELQKMTPSQFGAVLHSAAGIQRAFPEGQMIRWQGALGGGVLSHAAEHIGDLTHRMAEEGGMYGLEFVQPKVERMHGLLHQGYGFEREHEQNMRGNGSDPQEVRERGRDYAVAHATVPTYTHPMALARAAAVSLGQHEFKDTRNHLSSLLTIVRNPTLYHGYMAQSGAVDFMATHPDLEKARRAVMEHPRYQGLKRR